MRELSVAEQRYQAVLAVIKDARTISEVAAQWRADRRSVNGWLARYEAAGLDRLVDRSHKPDHCPHEISAAIKATMLELRRRYWGPRRLVLA